MNHKIKFVIVSFALFFFATQAYSQNGGGPNMTPEERAQRQTDNMAETLSLSEAQKEKIYEVNLKFANKMKEAREAADGDWASMRETMVGLRNESQEEIKKYLTDEQFQKWQKIQEERREKRGDRPRRNGR